MSKPLFVQLKKEATVGLRTYAAGSVVEVDKRLHDRLTTEGVAELHSGPSFEPPFDDDGELPPAKRKVERRG